MVLIIGAFAVRLFSCLVSLGLMVLCIVLNIGCLPLWFVDLLLGAFCCGFRILRVGLVFAWGLVWFMLLGCLLL